LAGRVTDHGGKLSDQENGRVAEVLKVFQLSQHHRVAQMQIRSGGINAELHAQRHALACATLRASRPSPLRE